MVTPDWTALAATANLVSVWVNLVSVRRARAAARAARAVMPLPAPPGAAPVSVTVAAVATLGPNGARARALAICEEGRQA